MEISLTPEHEQFIQEKLKSGKYYCASEVVRDAIELLEERDHLNQRYLEKLKKEVTIGLEQLDPELVPLLLIRLVSQESCLYEQASNLLHYP